MYRMTATGNKKAKRLRDQYTKLEMAKSRPTVPMVGQKDHFHRYANRIVLYATGTKIRIGRGVDRKYRLTDSLTAWQHNKNKGRATMATDATTGLLIFGFWSTWYIIHATGANSPVNTPSFNHRLYCGELAMLYPSGLETNVGT
jgi:hypothetical protein